MDDAIPLFEFNKISNNRAGGAVLAGKTRATLINNEFSGNGFAGLMFKEHAEPRLISNRIVSNYGYGVLQHGNSSAVLQDCMFADNMISGVSSAGESKICLYNCTIRSCGTGNSQNQRTGVFSQQKASVVIVGGVISGHVGSNVLARDQSSISIRYTSILGSLGAGIVMQDSCTATLVSVTSQENRVCNIIAIDNATWSAHRCILSDSRGIGVIATGASKGVLTESTVCGNLGRGIHCTGEVRKKLFCFGAILMRGGGA